MIMDEFGFITDSQGDIEDYPDICSPPDPANETTEYDPVEKLLSMTDGYANVVKTSKKISVPNNTNDSNVVKCVKPKKNKCSAGHFVPLPVKRKNEIERVPTVADLKNQALANWKERLEKECFSDKNYYLDHLETYYQSRPAYKQHQDDQLLKEAQGLLSHDACIQKRIDKLKREEIIEAKTYNEDWEQLMDTFQFSILEARDKKKYANMINVPAMETVAFNRDAKKLCEREKYLYAVQQEKDIIKESHPYWSQLSAEERGLEITYRKWCLDVIQQYRDINGDGDVEQQDGVGEQQAEYTNKTSILLKSIHKKNMKFKSAKKLKNAIIRKVGRNSKQLSFFYALDLNYEPTPAVKPKPSETDHVMMMGK